jgi:hypothetical protein
MKEWLFLVEYLLLSVVVPVADCLPLLDDNGLILLLLN